MKFLKFFLFIVATTCIASTMSGQVRIIRGVTQFGTPDVTSFQMLEPGSIPNGLDSVVYASRTSYGMIMDVYGGINQICRSGSPNSNYAYYLSNGAGGFNYFRISTQGAVYAMGGYSQASDENLKTDIEQIDGSVLNKLDNINAYTYYYKLPEGEEKGLEKQERRIGFLAQELMQEFPELVIEMENGTYAVRYSEMAPVLLACIKELRGEVAELKEALMVYEKPGMEPTAVSETFVSKAFIKQNKPNPFNNSTQIEYNTGDSHNAAICIYDLSGKELKKYRLNDIEGVLSIAADELDSGIYIYGLLVDDEMADTKRMVISK